MSGKGAKLTTSGWVLAQKLCEDHWLVSSFFRLQGGSESTTLCAVSERPTDTIEMNF